MNGPKNKKRRKTLYSIHMRLLTNDSIVSDVLVVVSIKKQRRKTLCYKKAKQLFVHVTNGNNNTQQFNYT